MTSENSWPLFHAYNKMANRGVVTPLTCSYCYGNVFLQLGKNDEPELHCYRCGVDTQPGTDLINRMRRELRNHNFEV